MRPPREAYVRATVELAGIEMIAGIEMRESEEFEGLKDAAQHIMRSTGELADRLPRITRGVVKMGAADVAEEIERVIKVYFPDRAYFIEVCAGTERDGWVQIFQPWERP